MSESNRQTERDQPAASPQAPLTWKRMVGIFAAFIPTTAIITLAIGWLAGETPRTMLGYFVFIMMLLGLGVLGARFKIVGDIAKKGFVLSLRILWWVLITLGPLSLFYWLSKFVLVGLTGVFQVIVFVAWGLLLAGALTLIIAASWRERLFNALRNVGRFTPFIYSFNVLFIAMVFFSSVTYVLVEHELVSFSGSSERDVSPEALNDFYLWHVLDAVPLLKVTETLHWEKPLTYDRGWVGLLLLGFKVTVIVPVIAAFAWYWAHLGGTRTKDE
jgi:hypothetical protein